MKQRLFLVSIALLAMLCISAGQPWLLFGDLPQQNEAYMYAEGPDMTFREAARKPEDEGKWTFTADTIRADHVAEYIEAEGDCTFTDGKNTLRADFARYYKQTGWVILKGNVRANWEGDHLEAEEAEFDLNTMLGWLKNGMVFVVQDHLYLESQYIRKYKGDSYTFTNAKVTKCSGDKPAWSIQAEEGDITIDGYTKIWHTTFMVRDTPVAYLPYMQIPSGGKRQSGFLFPEIRSSTRFGLDVTLPYYWVVNEEMDVTFYQNWMSSRGYRQGLELRHADDANVKGYWRFDWLNDAKTYASSRDDDDDSLVGDDGLLRPNRNRWWWRSKFNGYLGTPAWKVMVDIDMASDQDYLKEFSTGYLGYSQSRNEMLAEFGRDINPADDEERQSVIMLTRDYESFGLAGKIEYNQNLEYMNGNGDDSDNPTLQKLPELNLYTFKDTIGETPLEFESSVQYDYFHRNSGTTGHRLNIQPEFSLPLSTDWITVTPKVGAIGNFYYVDKWNPDAKQIAIDGLDDDNDVESSGAIASINPTAGIDLLSEVTKVYPGETPQLELSEANVGQSRWAAVKHTIIPRVGYEYQPRRTGLEDRPYFDYMDRFFGESKLTYSLTNVLDRKRQTISLTEDGRPTLATDYLDFLNVRLEQSFDYSEATRKEDTEAYERRPFSDIMAEVLLKPFMGLRLSTQSYYSPYLSQLTEQAVQAGYTFDEGSDIYLGYDFLDTRDEYKHRISDHIQVLTLGGNYNIAKNLVLSMEYRRDLHNAQDLEKKLGLLWTGECYEIGFDYSRTPGDNRFGLRFDLTF